MRSFLFLYWVFCYSVMVTTLVISCGRALMRPSPAEKAHCVLLVSFGLIMAGTTLATLWRDPEREIVSVLNFLATSGSCLGIYAIPAFALALMPWLRIRRMLAAIALALSLGLWLLSAFFWNSPSARLIAFVTYTVCSLVIAGVSIGGLIARILKKPKSVDIFWRRVSTNASIFSLIFLPGLFFIDFFSYLIPFFADLVRLGFSFFPLFFVIWDFSYLYNVVKQGFPSASTPPQESPLSSALMDEHRLSPREREVAALLVKGDSYKEVAAKLCISVATAKTHINRIYAKTATGSKIELLNRLSGK